MDNEVIAAVKLTRSLLRSHQAREGERNDGRMLQLQQLREMPRAVAAACGAVPDVPGPFAPRRVKVPRMWKTRSPKTRPHQRRRWPGGERVLKLYR